MPIARRADSAACPTILVDTNNPQLSFSSRIPSIRTYRGIEVTCWAIPHTLLDHTVFLGPFSFFLFSHHLIRGWRCTSLSHSFYAPLAQLETGKLGTLVASTFACNTATPQSTLQLGTHAHTGPGLKSIATELPPDLQPRFQLLIFKC